MSSELVLQDLGADKHKLDMEPPISNRIIPKCKMGLPTRLLRFVTFVHLPFSARSLDLSCRFTSVCEGIEPSDRVMAKFYRS